MWIDTKEYLMNLIDRILKCGMTVVIILIMGSVQAQDVEPIGGPYEPDSATVMLLHFDGTLTNESAFSEDAIGHGSIAFVGQSPIDGGNQSAYMDNDSQTDSSYVSIPDADALDLTGNWTIEAWGNLFTYGATSEDHRWRPRFFEKPGDNTWYYSNFFCEMFGWNQKISTGYRAAPDGGGWPQVNSQDGTIQGGNWYHITFMRDTTEQILVQMIHDENLELVFFGSNTYDPITEAPPLTNNQPVTIGSNIVGAHSWFDGFVDEYRISNVVRNFAIPPVIKNVVQLTNKSSEESSYPIDAEILKIGPGSVSEAYLHYNTGTKWDSVAMTDAGNRLFTGDIPQQPRGTEILYYVSATDEYGMRATSPSTAELDSVFYEFAVWKPNSQTLAMNFEEGSGDAGDTTLYNHTANMVGKPVYSQDAVVGNYSIALEGDSSYLGIPSPFLTSEEFTVDVWFKADSIPEDGVRLIARQGGTWFQINYQIRFFGNGVIGATSFYPEPGEYLGDEQLTDTTFSIQPGQWYNAIYEMTDSTAAFMVKDTSNALLVHEVMEIDATPAITNGPLRIGHAGTDDNPFFAGKIDNVQIYNFAAYGIDAVTGTRDAPAILPDEVRLYSNYPNPFNPSTTIEYYLPRAQTIRLSVYDIRGHLVEELVSKKAGPGNHTIQWDGDNTFGERVASGMYLYRLETPEKILVGKMMLLR